MRIQFNLISSFQNSSRHQNISRQFKTHYSLQTRVWPLPVSLTVKAQGLLCIWRSTKTNYIISNFFRAYRNIENKIKIAVKSGQDIPIG